MGMIDRWGARWGHRTAVILGTINGGLMVANFATGSWQVATFNAFGLVVCTPAIWFAANASQRKLRLEEEPR